MALKGDIVTFDGEMGTSFIRHGAADPRLWEIRLELSLQDIDFIFFGSVRRSGITRS